MFLSRPTRSPRISHSDMIRQHIHYKVNASSCSASLNAEALTERITNLTSGDFKFSFLKRVLDPVKRSKRF